MGTIEAYYTGDGSVGLFSYTDNDVYHSYFGALTEAYEKFVLPIFDTDIFLKDDIKVLDICYGIGYNTKSFLNYFLSKQKKLEEKFLEKNKKNRKNNFIKNHYNETIYTDNNLCLNDSVEEEKNKNFSKNHDNKNILEDKKIKIKIDAIDTNEKLFYLSPFIKTKNYKNNNYLKKANNKIFNKTELKNKIKNIKYFNPKIEYEISPLISLMMYEFVKENEKFIKNKNFINLKKDLKENKKILDDFLLDLAKKYEKWGYKTSSWTKLSTFLHNIYYRYISKRYKMDKFSGNFLLNSENLGDLLNNYRILRETTDIFLNFYNEDARCAIQKSTDKYDLVFLDAFTPSLVPSLWSVEFFKLIYSHLADDGILVTYSNSAAIRKALLDSGFYIGKNIYQNEKSQGTIASKNIKNIKYKLDDFEMGILNTKAGIPYRDNMLNMDNSDIIRNRELEYSSSSLKTSSQYIKEFKNAI